MPAKVYIDGSIVAAEDAWVSAFDRGFIYGDGVFETMRVYGGRPFALAEHIERLFTSAQLIDLDMPCSAKDVQEAVSATLLAAGMDAAMLRIVVTRGNLGLGLGGGQRGRSMLMVQVLTLPELPEKLYRQGVSAIVAPYRRGADGVSPAAKTLSSLVGVLASRWAQGAGADEALLLDAEGRLAEATTANVFVLLDGVWCTPPVQAGILNGITRQTLLALCNAKGIAACERPLWPDELAAAQAAFLCSSVRELVPLVRFAGQPVGEEVQPAFDTLLSLYRSQMRSS